MDRKAAFRAKLRESEQKKDKRIDSPLVRYNEHGQPICKVCNLVLKSESIWPAHQVSRKHHEAIEKLKAAAEAKKGNSSINNNSSNSNNNNNNEQKSIEIQKATRPASSLPSNFFDNKDSKKPKTEKTAEKPEFKVPKSRVPANFFDNVKEQEELTESYEKSQPERESTELTESKEKSQPAKGALPEGFFDNKDADLKARGVQPVKVDINEAVKEFEKEIQDNLQDVDNRLEDEEIDAAEEQGELLTIEQKEYREKVEMVKQKLMEAKAAKLARAKQKPAFETKDSSDSDSDSDDDGESFNVDWRAQHL
ncbi:hypothetical protein LUZ60_011168 [Juncus effusus]|nr:hypothetical protein LUZ60_011168 [Juncus effusus]